MLVVNTIPYYWLAGLADSAGAFFLTLLGQSLIIVAFQSIGLLISVTICII